MIKKPDNVHSLNSTANIFEGVYFRGWIFVLSNETFLGQTLVGSYFIYVSDYLVII